MIKKYPTSEEIAWAAGLFEGEGHIGCRPNGSKTNLRMYPRLILSMTDGDVVRRFAEIVGVGKIGTPRLTKSGKLAYIWTAHSRKSCEPVLKMLFPYFGERRRARASIEIVRMMGIRYVK